MTEGQATTQLLADRARAAPAAPALIDAVSGAVLSWAELEDAAMRMAAKLAAQGVGPGDRVAVAADPGPRFAAILHACIALGAAIVPLSPRLPAAERRRLLDASEAVLHLDAEGSRRLRTGPAQTRAGISADPDVAVLYTSGSSGLAPKGVRLSLGGCAASARGCAEALEGMGPDDRWLLLLGPHRVGGLAVFWRSALSGAAVVHVPKFDEPTVRYALERKPTLASLVPVMLHRLIEAGLTGGLRGLRALLVGGAPASRADVLTWSELGLTVCPSYGMTETGSQVSVVPPGRARELAGTAGLVHSQAVVEADAGPGQTGEILVGGAVLTPGYTDQHLDDGVFAGVGAERRLRTGDLGSITDGVLSVAGRRDRVFISGGEKVQPEEVEAVLLEHPAVRDAGVWGSPDPRYGSVVNAVVVGDVDAPALQAWCRERLAPHKVPRRFSFAEAVPRSEDGKLQRPPAS
jgi:o-succinylbenzoate---CoA ligase